MKIKANITGPLYDELYLYNKKKSIRRIKEGCKKNLLLTISIGETSEYFARQVYEEIKEELEFSMGNANLLSLSECDWGTKDCYNEETLILCDSICIPKDYDQPKKQKEEVLELIRGIVRKKRADYRYSCMLLAE